MQAAKDFLRQFDGHRSNRDGRRSDGGFGADALGHSKRPGKQLIELRPYRSNRAGSGVGFLDLSEDLGLANDH